MTANHVQGVFGEFKAVIDIAGGTLTANQVQGTFGEFKPVLDNAQTAAATGGATDWPKFQRSGFWNWEF